MNNKPGDFGANLNNLKNQFSQDAAEMTQEKNQIEQLKREINMKQAQVKELEDTFKITEHKYHDHERQIRQATQELEEIKRDTAREHSLYKKP